MSTTTLATANTNTANISGDLEVMFKASSDGVKRL